LETLIRSLKKQGSRLITASFFHWAAAARTEITGNSVSKCHFAEPNCPPKRNYLRIARRNASMPSRNRAIRRPKSQITSYNQAFRRLKSKVA
jgi:hypothetical protein